MSEVRQVVSHHAAAMIHFEIAAIRWAYAVERLWVDDPREAAWEIQIACDNLVFAAHHAAEAKQIAAATAVV